MATPFVVCVLLGPFIWLQASRRNARVDAYVTNDTQRRVSKGGGGEEEERRLSITGMDMITPPSRSKGDYGGGDEATMMGNGTARVIRLCFTTLLLLYAPLVSASISAFVCTRGVGGTTLLVHDTAVSCDTNEHFVAQVVAAIVLVALGLLFPLARRFLEQPHAFSVSQSDASSVPALARWLKALHGSPTHTSTHT